MTKTLIFLLCLVVLAGCDSLELEDDAEPTWFFTGPTIQPTRSPVIALATNPAESPLTGPGQNDPTAAALPANSSLPPVVMGELQPGVRMVQISLTAGRTALGYLYESVPLDIEGFIIPARYPGVLLLGATREAWGGFPQRLLNSGNSVLLVETENLFVEDFQDIFISLQEAGTVDAGAMAVIGAEAGADLAIAGCALVLGCDAVVLLSPSGSDAVLNAMRNYTPRPAFLAASNTDTSSYQAVQTLYQASVTENTELAMLLNAGRGAEIFTNSEQFTVQVINWLSDILLEELTPLPLEDIIAPGFDLNLINPDLDAPFDPGFGLEFEFNFDDEDF